MSQLHRIETLAASLEERLKRCEQRCRFEWDGVEAAQRIGEALLLATALRQLIEKENVRKSFQELTELKNTPKP